jgi:hypothetical protein
MVFAATKLPAPVMQRIALLVIKFGPKQPDDGTSAVPATDEISEERTKHV